VADEKITVEYVGSPAFAGAFAQRLEEAGLRAEYDPPLEGRGAGEHAEFVVGVLIGVYGSDVRRLTIDVAKRFRARFPKAKITVDGKEIESDVDGSDG
jgi:hypothetical protein